MNDVKTPRLRTLLIDDTDYETLHTNKHANRPIFEPKNPKVIKAFLPGLIPVVHVRPGQAIKAGEALLVLEAMKMLNEITSPLDGIIKTVHVEAGIKVTKGQLLIELE